MSVDKLVDSTQLDADLTTVANAIRTKGGTAAQLSFPNGMAQAIANIPSGGVSAGIEFSSLDGTNLLTAKVYGTIIPEYMFYSMTSLTTINSDNVTTIGQRAFYNCTNLEFPSNAFDKVQTLGVEALRGCTFVNVSLPSIQSVGNGSFRLVTTMTTCILGSIGHPVSSIHSAGFHSCTQSNLIITIYVNATTLAEAQAELRNAPWGATNATIVYRNSTTGEVITE